MKNRISEYLISMFYPGWTWISFPNFKVHIYTFSVNICLYLFIFIFRRYIKTYFALNLRSYFYLNDLWIVNTFPGFHLSTIFFCHVVFKWVKSIFFCHVSLIFIIYLFLIILIFVQLQFSAFLPHHYPSPQSNPPPSLVSTLPLVFVRVSFIVVPENPSPRYPFPPPLWL